MVDTNVLMSHLSLVERAFDNLMGAALEARWACACVCGVAWRGLDLQGKPLGSRAAQQLEQQRAFRVADPLLASSLPPSPAPRAAAARRGSLQWRCCCWCPGWC